MTKGHRNTEPAVKFTDLAVKAEKGSDYRGLGPYEKSDLERLEWGHMGSPRGAATRVKLASPEYRCFAGSLDRSIVSNVCSNNAALRRAVCAGINTR